MTNEEKMRAAIEVAKESLENGEEEGSLVDFCNTLLAL